MRILKSVWGAIIFSILTEAVICAITIPLKDTAAKEIYRFFHVIGPCQYWVTMIVAFVGYRSLQILAGAQTTRRTVPTLIVLIAIGIATSIWGYIGFRQAIHQVAYPRIQQTARNEREAESARRYLAMQSFYPLVLMVILTIPAGLILSAASRRANKEKELQPSV